MTPPETAEQLRLAHDRLVACYETAIAKQDAGAAVAAQRELNKLLGLYAVLEQSDEPDAADLRDQLAAVRGHLIHALVPYLDPTVPASEMARLAAAEILRLRGNPR